MTVQAGPAAAGRRTGRLSEGTLVEASVVGRVLGMRILRIDAVVLLTPAVPPPVPPTPAPSTLPRPGRLAGALRSIDEGAELLAEARRLRQGGGLAAPPPTAAGRRPQASAAAAGPGRS